MRKAIKKRKHVPLHGNHAQKQQEAVPIQQSIATCWYVKTNSYLQDNFILKVLNILAASIWLKKKTKLTAKLQKFNIF